MFFHEKFGNRCAYSIPVLFVLLMAISFYYCYLKGFLLRNEIEVVIVPSLIFHITLLLLTWSYIKCLMTDPMSIPLDFDSLTEELLPNQDYNEQDYRDAKISICEKCNLKRPPRTHHCSLCNRCILRMDHHCPWVGNCVGFGNHKFFIQFLFYLSLTLTNLGLSCLFSLESFSLDDCFEGVIGTFAGISLAFTTTSLTGFHLYLIFSNKTTLEVRGGERFNVFDTGNYKINFFQIFGKDLKGIIFPINVQTTVNGFIYPLRIRNNSGEIVLIRNKLII